MRAATIAPIIESATHLCATTSAQIRSTRSRKGGTTSHQPKPISCPGGSWNFFLTQCFSFHRFHQFMVGPSPKDFVCGNRNHSGCGPTAPLGLHALVKRRLGRVRSVPGSAVCFLAKPLPKRHHSFLARIIKRAQSHVLSFSQKFFGFRHCRSLVGCLYGPQFEPSHQ